LHRFCTAFRTASGSPLEVTIGHLQVMLGGDGLLIPDPGADDVQREDGGQFRLACGPEVVEQARPGGQPRTADDAP
jgi:hypothetical protein